MPRSMIWTPPGFSSTEDPGEDFHTLQLLHDHHVIHDLALVNLHSLCHLGGRCQKAVPYPTLVPDDEIHRRVCGGLPSPETSGMARAQAPST